MFDDNMIGVSSSKYENYDYVISDHYAVCNYIANVVPVGEKSFD